jgi:hypothetical protein
MTAEGTVGAPTCYIDKPVFGMKALSLTKSESARFHAESDSILFLSSKIYVYRKRERERERERERKRERERGRERGRELLQCQLFLRPRSTTFVCCIQTD